MLKYLLRYNYHLLYMRFDSNTLDVLMPFIEMDNNMILFHDLENGGSRF